MDWNKFNKIYIFRQLFKAGGVFLKFLEEHFDNDSSKGKNETQKSISLIILIIFRIEWQKSEGKNSSWSKNQENWKSSQQQSNKRRKLSVWVNKLQSLHSVYTKCRRPYLFNLHFFNNSLSSSFHSNEYQFVKVDWRPWFFKHRNEGHVLGNIWGTWNGTK